MLSSILCNWEHKMKHGIRYARLVEIGEPGQCWNWLGSINPRTGYGKKQWLGETWLAHRWVWTMLFGIIPKKMTINHLCGNRKCVNPHHLEVVSQADNCRHGKGTKLTIDQAIEIKQAGRKKVRGDGPRLAKKFSVSKSLIHDIWNGRAWKEI